MIIPPPLPLIPLFSAHWPGGAMNVVNISSLLLGKKKELRTIRFRVDKAGRKLASVSVRAGSGVVKQRGVDLIAGHLRFR